MCEIDLDPCEVFTTKTVTAKKEHRCGCCERTIRAGEIYHRTFAIFEGDASTHKHCRDCERDMAAFAKAHDGARITPDGFEQLILECIDEGDDSVRRWKAMRERIRTRSVDKPVDECG